MKITEVRIKRVTGHAGEEKLRGFCSITFDDEFVIRDLKIIEGARGLFVAMPSRRVMRHCTRCRAKNHLKAHYCNECAADLRRQPIRHPGGRPRRLFVDIAHPINPEMREMVHRQVIEAFHAAEEEDPTAMTNRDGERGLDADVSHSTWEEGAES